MRWRSLTPLLAGLICFVTAILCWRFVEDRQTRNPTSRSAPPARASQTAKHDVSVAGQPAQPASIRLLSLESSNVVEPLPSAAVSDNSRFPYRLSNTAKTFGQLVRSDQAILLENALLDTGQPVALAIPAHLQAGGDPGSYIVQSRTILDDAFRARLQEAGAGIISYIPNNAYLVRISAAGARQLAAWPQN